MLSQPLKVVLFRLTNKQQSVVSRLSLQRLIMSSQSYSTAIKIVPSLESKYDGLLTQDSLSFLEKLHNNFEPRRQNLLAQRVTKQNELNDGLELDFLASTKAIRESNWTIATLPKPLLKRRVEITGPVDRKMVINALNSGSGKSENKKCFVNEMNSYCLYDDGGVFSCIQIVTWPILKIRRPRPGQICWMDRSI